MYESQSRVTSMTTTPAGHFVHIVLDTEQIIRVTPDEVQRCDIRVGDAIDPYVAGFGVRFDMRPGWSVPFSV